LTPRAEKSIDQWEAVDLPEAIQVTLLAETHSPETPLTQGVPIELCTLSRGEFDDRFIEERPYPPIGTTAKSKQWKQLMKNYDCPYDVYDSNGLLLFCGICHASYKSCATMAIRDRSDVFDNAPHCPICYNAAKARGHLSWDSFWSLKGIEEWKQFIAEHGPVFKFM